MLERGVRRTGSWTRGVAGGVVALLVAGCSLPMGDDDCALPGLAPGIELQVVNAATGASLYGTATISVTPVDPPGDAVQGPLSAPTADNALFVTYGRPGVYALVAGAPGYERDSARVRVRAKGSCGDVQTEHVTIELVPA